MKASFVTILLTSLFSVTSFAHGMNKAGPHGGYVRMPSNYHVELVTNAKETRVYFLDMTFKPVSIADASVSLSLKGKKSQLIKCAKEKDSFKCKISSFNGYKEITVLSSKEGKPPLSSTYKLPLSFE